jgi:hypothetical protein
MGKKSALVDKLVSKKKKKRELCLDLNSGSGMFINKSSLPTNNLIDNVLTVKQSEKPKKLKPVTSEKAHILFNIDKELNNTKPINLDSLSSFSNKEKPLKDKLIISNKEKPLKDKLIISNKEKPLKDKLIISNKEKPLNDKLIISNKEKPLNDKLIISNEDNKKKDSIFSTSNIINLSRKRYNKLLDKEELIQRKINYENEKIEKMKEQLTQLDYIKKSSIEQEKLYELEKKLKKIEIIKFLNQKKISIEKYRQNIEQYNLMMKKEKELNNKYNMLKINKVENNLKPILPKKIKYKKIDTQHYNIDIINKVLQDRILLYNKIIDKHKNNLLCIKNIETNKYNLVNDYYINNIDKLISFLKINNKHWNTLYNTNTFNFSIIIK